MTTDIYAKLELLDILIFGLCLLISIAVAFVAYYQANKAEDSLVYYLLMGRQLSLPFFVATLVATWYGGIFGVTAIAFESGIYNFITQGVFWYFTYLIMAFFFVNKIKAIDAMTLPELVEKQFGKSAAKVAAIFNLFNVIPIAYTISIGLFLQMLFGGDLNVWMILGLGIVLIYTSASGFRSVIYTDLWQFALMFSAVVIVLIISIQDFGGISYLKSSLPASHFQVQGQHSIWEMLAWGFIALSTLVDPNFYQRIFAAKNPRVAKRGIIISTGIWLIFDLCTTFGAMYARASMPNADAKNAYMLYAFDLLPVGLKGFFLAGIFATILSTLDSYLFVAGNTLTYDLLYQKQKRTNVHRLGLFFIAIISIILSNVFEGNIRMVWKTLGSYSAGSLLVVIVYAFYFPKRLKEKDFLMTVLSAALMMSLCRLLLPGIESLYVGLGCSLLSTAYYHFSFRISK
tara:strand:+ start:17556 stop:18929 length:1374 start_codon:yes stop_codon:yes gene_type:complete